jgi:hypothetical protein
MEINNILNVPFGSRTQITKDTDLYLICKRNSQSSTGTDDDPNNYILLKVDNRFYRSRVLEGMTIVVENEKLRDIQTFNHNRLPLKAPMTVTILKGEYFVKLPSDIIHNMQELVAYLKFAERMCCNLTPLLETVILDGFLLDIMRYNLKLWSHNKVLLTAMNYKDYSQMHFTSNAGDANNAGVAAGYPNNDPINNPKLQKYVQKAKYEPIKKEIYSAFCTQEDFNLVIKYLIDLKANQVVYRVLQIILLSIEYCHLALKCPYLQSVVEVYPLLSAYMIYSMRIMYLEERAKYGYGISMPTLTNDERILFTLDDVIGLPYYSKYTQDCPYFVEPGYGLANHQGLLLPAFIKGKRGLYEREIAQDRLSKYTNNILSDIQWQYKTPTGTIVKTVLCGSAIPAIFVKNPLEGYCKSTDSYWQEYYPGQIEKLKHNIEYLESEEDNSDEYKLYTVDKNNNVQDANNNAPEGIVVNDNPINNVETDDNNEDTVISTEVELLPTLPDEIVRAHEHMEKVLGWKLDQKMKRAALAKAEDAQNNGDLQSKSFAQRILDTIPFVRIQNDNNADDKGKDEMVTLTPQAELINEFTPDEKNADKYTDIDLMVETNDYEVFDAVAKMHFECIRAKIHISNIYMKPVLTENKYKYRIYGLTRNIEIFMVDSIPATISKFHLAPVRAWWDGNELYMLPTFVIAAMSGVSYDLRWISCVKDLRDVILKYFQRGFGTVVNLKEAKNMIEYVNNSNKWPTHVMPQRLHGRWNAASRWAKMQIYGCNIRAIFNPSQSHTGIWHGIKCDTVNIIEEIDWITKRELRDGWHIYPKPITRSKMLKRIKEPEKISKTWAKNYCADKNE